MPFTIAKAYHARADHCSLQADLAIDQKVKKYWEDLASDWLALEETQLAIAAKG
jgi:hypothetical protein